MSDSETPISPRRSVRRINQDLHCLVISEHFNDTQACQSAISSAMQALSKHGELANHIAQARK